MSELTKYNVARSFYIPMPKQGSTDYAVAADWTPVAGDVKVIKDYTSIANIGTLPFYSAGYPGLWVFQLTQTELSAKCIQVVTMDTAPKAVADNTLIIETMGDPAAQFPYDFSLSNAALGAIFYGSVTGSTAVNSLIDSKLTASDTDFYKGRILLPLSGALRYQGSR